MCRFLLLKSIRPVEPLPILHGFAEMAERSKSYDGDWQGDGWGISWLNDLNEWQVYRSLLPIWEDYQKLAEIQASKMILIHARSASFEKDKNNIMYNQPFANPQYAFVFNGLLKGVRIPQKTEGEIGAQKLWSLLSHYLDRQSPDIAIDRLRELIAGHTRQIQAFNIGLSTHGHIYFLNCYQQYMQYYQLHYHCSLGLTIVSSEPIKGFEFIAVNNGKVFRM